MHLINRVSNTFYLADSVASSDTDWWIFVGGVGVGAGALMLVLALCGII